MCSCIKVSIRQGLMDSVPCWPDLIILKVHQKAGETVDKGSLRTDDCMCLNECVSK